MSKCENPFSCFWFCPFPRAFKLLFARSSFTVKSIALVVVLVKGVAIASLEDFPCGEAEQPQGCQPKGFTFDTKVGSTPKRGEASRILSVATLLAFG